MRRAFKVTWTKNMSFNIVSLQFIIQWRQPVIYRIKSIINLEYNNWTDEETEKCFMRVRVWISLTFVRPPHCCACQKPRPEIPTSYVDVFLCSMNWNDNAGIVDHIHVHVVSIHTSCKGSCGHPMYVYLSYVIYKMCNCILVLKLIMK